MTAMKSKWGYVPGGDPFCGPWTASTWPWWSCSEWTSLIWPCPRSMKQWAQWVEMQGPRKEKYGGRRGFCLFSRVFCPSLFFPLLFGKKRKKKRLFLLPSPSFFFLLPWVSIQQISGAACAMSATHVWGTFPKAIQALNWPPLLTMRPIWCAHRATVLQKSTFRWVIPLFPQLSPRWIFFAGKKWVGKPILIEKEIGEIGFNPQCEQKKRWMEEGGGDYKNPESENFFGKDWKLSKKKKKGEWESGRKAWRHFFLFDQSPSNHTFDQEVIEKIFFFSSFFQSLGVKWQAISSQPSSEGS